MTLNPKIAIKLLYTLLLCNIYVESHPNGAPDGACQTMTPQHGNNSSQDLDSHDFAVIILKPEGNRYPVIIASLGQKFKGILLQARRSQNNDPEGEWDVPDGGLFKNLACNQLAAAGLTHTSNVVKNASDHQFVWKAPESSVVRYYKIYATIVVEFSKFYVMIPSIQIEVPSVVSTTVPVSAGNATVPVVVTSMVQSPTAISPSSPSETTSSSTTSSAQGNRFSVGILFTGVAVALFVQFMKLVL